MSYFYLLMVVLAARVGDLFSTYLVTPNLSAEGNPIFRRFGWRAALWLNVLIIGMAPLWPQAAIVIATMSLLAAAHNFATARVMRGGFGMLIGEAVPFVALGLGIARGGWPPQIVGAGVAGFAAAIVLFWVWNRRG